jgi:hypothetical protein
MTSRLKDKNVWAQHLAPPAAFLKPSKLSVHARADEIQSLLTLRRRAHSFHS